MKLQGLKRAILGLNQRLAHVTALACVGMVLIGAFNALARYLGKFTGVQLSSNFYLELQWYLFSLIFLYGAAQTLREDGHVRVDVIYSRLTGVRKAWIDLIGTLLFFIPFCILMIWTSLPSVQRSWAVLEKSPDPGGLARYPIKTAVPIAFFLLLLQGLCLIPDQLDRIRTSRGSTKETVDVG